MKRLLLLSTLTLASLCFAEPPADASAEKAAAEKLVKSELLQPLAAKELKQSRFSRARLPPQERRVRVLDTPRQDSNGATFFAFEVDARFGDWDDDAENPWRKADITGCVYPEKKEVFVKSGSSHRPAAFMAGKKVKPAESSVCQPATLAQAR
ncbi:MAG: hypothetical protein AB1938_06210 [Myxococcota bacterium]